MTDTRVDDIALFFSEHEKTNKRWLPHSVYADPDFKLGSMQEYWRDAVFLKQASAGPGSDSFYVANLSNLGDPGMPPQPSNEAKTTLRTRGSEDTKDSPSQDRWKRSPEPVTPKAGDLVVIPWSDPDNAYLVPKERYLDETQCPPISDTSGADLRFMAITEGVVLANLPKTDPQGMTCYLLNLLSLRSNASFPGK